MAPIATTVNAVGDWRDAKGTPLDERALKRTGKAGERLVILGETAYERLRPTDEEHTGDRQREADQDEVGLEGRTRVHDDPGQSEECGGACHERKGYHDSGATAADEKKRHQADSHGARRPLRVRNDPTIIERRI